MHEALRNVTAVIFDVGGTLVHPDWRRLAKIIEVETGILFTPAQMHEAFYAMMQGRMPICAREEIQSAGPDRTGHSYQSCDRWA